MPTPPPRRLALRTQFIIGFGLILALNLISAVIGNLTLSNLQASFRTTLEESSRIRDLSLVVQREFLLARQSEANFMSSWRTVGVYTASSAYLDSIHDHLTLAQSRLRELDVMVKNSGNTDLQQLSQDTARLEPLLKTYQEAFAVTVLNIQERSGARGQERILLTTLSNLENSVAPLPDRRLYEQLLEIRAAEQAYFYTHREQHVGEVERAVGLFVSLADELSRSGVDIPDGLSLQARSHLETFTALVDLDRQIDENAAMFRSVTDEINEVTNRVGIESAQEVERARDRLSAASARYTAALLLTAALTLGLALAVALLLARGILKPLGQFSQAAHRIGQGDLEGSVTLPSGAAREFELVANAFNTMTERLRNLISSLEQRVVERTEALTQANQSLKLEVSERERAEIALVKQNAFLAALHHTALGLISRLDLGDLLESIVLRAGELVGTAHGFIYLLAPGEEEMERRVGTGIFNIDRVPRIKPGQGVTGIVWETGQPLIVNDYPAWPGRPQLVDPDLVNAMVGVPLNSGSQVVGVLALAHEGGSGRTFGDEEVDLLARFAQLASIALDNARLYTETEQRVAELALVNRVGQAATSQLELQALVELVGEKLREIFSAQIVYIALLDRSRERIEFPYYYENGLRNDESSIAFGEGFTSKVLQDRQPLLLNGEDEISALNVQAIGTAARSYLAVPVHFGGEATGVISVQNTEQEGAFSEADVRLLTTIAANVGLAIQNARLFEETQREKEYLESLVEISPVAIVTLDPDSNVLSWNPAAERLFGYQLAEVTGRNIDTLIVPPELYSEVADYSRQAMEQGGMHAITRRRRKDNTLVDVEVLALPVNVDGELVGFLAIYHDISDLQRARQEAEAATQAKSAFLATMSHEIRTPMNAIIGMSSLLLNTELTPEQQEFAEIIRVGGENLLTIINDILDFSKIEAGRMELENEPFELRPFLESAMDLLAGKAAEKKLDLAYEIEPDVPSAIVGDITRLRQILLNLLNNALKFTERGEVVLSVMNDEGRTTKDESVVRPSSFVVLRFTVHDTGIGIPPDRLDRLFQSFSQVDASTSRRYGGTGLGLAISKRLVELMGGEMWVESQVGVGTSFHFTIQTRPAEGFQPQPRWSGEQPELAGRRLLIVDDNDTNRRILSLHTQAWGMLPQDTASPVQALEWIRRGDDFDAVILDVQMPEMDGITLAQEIRKLKKSLPLVMFSSLGQRELDGDANEFTASQSAANEFASNLFAAHLTKPLKPSQLYDALINLFGSAREGPKARRRPAKGEKLAIDPDMAERLPLRILLAEDNLVNQKLALRMLQQMGYQADVAANGLETIRALEKQPYDVILMDVQMPEMDGLEATRQIIQRWGDERPRIIAMTANAMQGDRETFLRAGMDDYLSKPVRVDELVGALQRSQSAGAGVQGSGDKERRLGAGERRR